MIKGLRATFPDVDHQGAGDGRDINPVAGKSLDLKPTVGRSLEKLGTSGPSTKRENEMKAYKNEETRIVMWGNTHRVTIFDRRVLNNCAAVLYVFGMAEEFAECVWGEAESFC